MELRENIIFASKDFVSLAIGLDPLKFKQRFSYQFEPRPAAFVHRTDGPAHWWVHRGSIPQIGKTDSLERKG